MQLAICDRDMSESSRCSQKFIEAEDFGKRCVRELMMSMSPLESNGAGVLL